MSCEEGEILPPTGNTFTVTASESATYTTNDFEVGESVSVSVDIVASQGIGLFGIDKVVNEGAAQDITANFTNLPSPGATSFSGTYEVSVSENVGDMVQIIIRSSPQGGTAFTSDTYTYDVVAQGQGGGGGVFPLLRSQVSVALGAQGTPATGSYLNTSNGTVYLNAEASALSNAEKAAIDITFGVVGTTTPTIISPDEREGLSFNNPMGAQASATTFKSEALASLNAVTSSDVENDVDHSSCSAKTIGISANNTFSFVNAAGAKGYFRVTNITGTGNDRTATLDVLVQTVQ